MNVLVLISILTLNTIHDLFLVILENLFIAFTNEKFLSLLLGLVLVKKKLIRYKTLVLQQHYIITVNPSTNTLKVAGSLVDVSNPVFVYFNNVVVLQALVIIILCCTITGIYSSGTRKCQNSPIHDKIVVSITKIGNTAVHLIQI